MATIRPVSVLRKIVRELLLSSGQFALFYLLMNFSKAGLTFGAIGAWFPVFLSDPTHVYILIGGGLLALSLGLGRVDVLKGKADTLLKKIQSTRWIEFSYSVFIVSNSIRYAD